VIRFSSDRVRSRVMDPVWIISIIAIVIVAVIALRVSRSGR
jgi:hypothetical protein